jgi:hypothetical protein
LVISWRGSIDLNLSDFNELHYITDITNMPSIMANGILSHNLAKRFPHKSVAMAEIQERRDKKKVPRGKFLHDYVNLYFCARNPMLYKLKDSHAELCILRIDKEALNLPNVILTDGNAAANYTAFAPFPAGLLKIDCSLVFATYWKDQDPIIEKRKKRAKCAEILIPNKVDVCYIIGAYVSCNEAKFELEKITPNLSVTINSTLFFK